MAKYTITETHESTGEEIKASFKNKDALIDYLMVSLEMSSPYLVKLEVA